MRRLTARDANEKGAVAVLVALLLVVLLGFVAIAVDVGVIYSERAQLQNGADAAAIAVAQECARGATNPTPNPLCSTASSLAGALANRNALDGTSSVRSIDLSTPRKVTVTTSAKENGAPADSISLYFARALGVKSGKITASSSAQWGTPSKGPAILPLAVASCKLNIPPDGSAGAEQVLDQARGCGTLPGGFGWLPPSSTTCTVSATAVPSSASGSWFDVDPGASAPSSCTAADFSKVNNQTVLLPVYDAATGTGSTGKYYIKGFAAFHVTGYHFADINWPGSVTNKAIMGYFVKFVSFSQAFELGNSPDLGATVARLTL